MKKGDRISTKYGTYQLAGKWNGAWVLAPMLENDNECLIYLAEEIAELIERGELKKA